MSQDKGLRYNAGKLRYDLVPAFAQQEYVRVLTKGAEKYADRNWELGMRWSTVTQSLARHFAAFQLGEDYDPETGCLHTAHIMCNAAFLTEYYKIYPQGDDRPHKYQNRPKIGLDIDEVLCDFVGAWEAKFGKHSHINGDVSHWNFSYDLKKLGAMPEDELAEFYMNMKPKIDPKSLPFEPHCYITSRSVPEELTKQWLQLHGFPTVKVYSLKLNESKVAVAQDAGVEWFVDDRYENFVELNNAGICCFLLDAPHNQKYNVGYKRIASLSDLL